MSITLKAIPENLLLGIMDLIEAEKLITSTEYKANDLTEIKLLTNIVDKDTLVKTLEDFNIEEIIESCNAISCNYGDLKLKFFKTEESTPYTIEIKCHDNMSANELIKNIAEGYNLNAQEISYNTIKENLQKENLLINEEEIFDDNTIVLTVNLE